MQKFIYAQAFGVGRLVAALLVFAARKSNECMRYSVRLAAADSIKKRRLAAALQRLAAFRSCSSDGFDAEAGLQAKLKGRAPRPRLSFVRSFLTLPLLQSLVFDRSDLPLSV